ncbi:lipoprotein [Streptomyces sp. C]|uniref:lipoprotein n=1 Tax=Streptomyces sp. C TaxID=253839 RepID=UPI0001B54774|nr:lipoprotein [Streptomyces sp. C]
MIAATKKIAGGLVATALVLCAAGCSGSGPAKPGAPGGQSAKKGPAAPDAPGSLNRLIGDGSTAYTGSQSNVQVPKKLKPGEKPPQFVVFSWDGAGEDSQKLFSHFREVGKQYNARMTYFLSGVYLLPEEKRSLYTAPQHSPGLSDIGFGDLQGIKDTATQVRAAWLEGNEIGTHFNGHFCGPDGGVGTWSVAEWKSEINQAKSFVKNWKTNAGLKNMAPLPFDYDKELIGARTPCLEGQKNFMLAAKDMGFRYDSSGISKQIWPKKTDGLWDLPLQLVPMPGRAFDTLSMDYNYMVNQSGTTTQGDPAQHQYWGDQMRDGLRQAFDRAYQGNRAPLIIGNHFESWNGGTYMRAVEESIKDMCTKPEVRCVPFRELADWLDAQNPKTLEWMRTLDVGEAPKEGWTKFLTAGPPAPPAAPPGADKVKQAEERAAEQDEG